MEVSFQHTYYLWLLLTIPLLVIAHFYILRYAKVKALKFANFEAIARVTGGEILSKKIFLLIIRVFILTFIIFAVSGTTLWYKGLSAKYDMILAIDASSSMMADDYPPNRLEAAKDSSILFTDNIKANVRVGVVSFSGAAKVEQKITGDLTNIKNSIKGVKIQELSGTDIGQALITSSNLFLEEEIPKAIILLTDGQSNVGITPADAIEYIGPKVVIYTIGIGTTEGGTFNPITAALKLDEDTLQFIAKETGGKYYRAEDEESLKTAFKEIAAAKEKKLQKNISLHLFLLAFLLLFIEWTMLSTKYKTI